MMTLRQFRCLSHLFISLLVVALPMARCSAGEAEKEQLQRAISFHQRGSYTQAVAIYDKLIEGDPNAVSARANRALCNEYLGRHDRADADYTQALELSDAKSELLLSRGLCRLSAGRHQQALEDLQACVSLDTGNGVAWLGIGLCHHHLGDAEQAGKDMHTALDADPDAPAKLIRREVAKSRSSISSDGISFYAELRGDNDPAVQAERAAYREFLDAMTCGYWMDGKFFYTRDD